MSDGRRRFSVTVPDWGQDHLSPEAIAAYVDNELADGPHGRATQHLAECPECAAQVAAHGQARSALRSAAGPTLPSSLLTSLRSIPQDTDLPGSPPGLAMTVDGQLVSVLRPERHPATDAPLSVAPPQHDVRSATTRRMRLGAGAAVSGLALGALAFGASGVASGPPAQVGAADRGVFDGPVLGGPSVVEARLRLTPAGLADPVSRTPGSFLGSR